MATGRESGLAGGETAICCPQPAHLRPSGIKRLGEATRLATRSRSEFIFLGLSKLKVVAVALEGLDFPVVLVFEKDLFVVWDGLEKKGGSES